MREILFRAYDKQKKQMMPVLKLEYWHPDSTQPERYELHGCVLGTLIDWDYVLAKDLALMQYTGMIDFAGKKIFKGDVLFWNGWKGEVYWDQDFAAWRAKHIGTLGGIPNLEIIGNIYEHPSLVEVKA